MTIPRVLPEPMTAFRIGDPNGNYPIWSVGGAKRTSGRWHEAGSNIIYASEHYSTAMLEKLVHYGGEIPPNQNQIEITIPAGVSCEVANVDLIKGWADTSGEAARRFGRDWYRERRSVILIVPSVVARLDHNLVFNASHPDFGRITVGLETPIWWDSRLFE